MTEKKNIAKKTPRAGKKTVAPNETSERQINTNLITPAALSWEKPKHMGAQSCAQWIRVLLQNWRQGTVGCKTRAEVSFSRKRPWRQKGTGRARVGSARSPIWRSGGIIFGPQPRVRTLKIAKQVKQGILCDLLWNLARKGRICTIDFESQVPKTSQAAQALKNAGLAKNVTVLLTPHDTIAQASFANLPRVQILLFDQLNAYNLAHSNRVVILKKDFELFKDMVSQWK